MEIIKEPKRTKTFFCRKCDFNCSKQSGYDRHLLTAKHKLEIMVNVVTPKSAETYDCLCGKSYKVYSGLWKHKKVCSLNSKSVVVQENPEEKLSMMDIIMQNKEIMDMLVLQNKEMVLQNKEQSNIIKEQSDTIRELIPKIGNNNNNNNNITTNNQFNLQVFLNEDCKDAINFSDFIKQIQVSFDDLENQAENGYIKGISKLFLESLEGLGQNKRPIHCSDKKRKTLYIKENNEWDKEGSHEVLRKGINEVTRRTFEVLRKGINEVTRRTFEVLIKSKEENAEEYEDNESDFSNKCVSIQKNLTPNYPRDTTICKVIEIITQNSGITEK